MQASSSESSVVRTYDDFSDPEVLNLAIAGLRTSRPAMTVREEGIIRESLSRPNIIHPLLRYRLVRCLRVRLYERAQLVMIDEDWPVMVANCVNLIERLVDIVGLNTVSRHSGVGDFMELIGHSLRTGHWY